jgi:PPOX class probable F420-dependent enzyme
MSKMDQATFQAFIDAPRIAHLIAVESDGTPHVAPVWYEYTGGQFLVFTPGTSVKLGHIRYDPRVAISIASEGEPYHYVTANGAAKINDGDVHHQAFSIARRYRGDGAERFLAELKDLHLITMTPSRFSSYIGD